MVAGLTFMKGGTNQALFLGTPDAAAAKQAVADAQAQVALATTQAGNAAQSATSVADVRAALAIRPVLPVGWFDPTVYPQGAWWTNPISSSLYISPLRIFTMRKASDIANPAWLDPAGLTRHDPLGNSLKAVDLSLVYDPVLQPGATVVTIHVSPAGNDTTGNGSSGTPYRTWTKAYNVMLADVGSTNTYDVVIHVTGAFIGTETFATGTYNLNHPTRIRIVNDGPNGGWFEPSMRENYTAATWAWVDLGDGFYQSTAGAISTNAKNTPLIYDPSVTEDDGRPTPSPCVTGTYASGAAAKAAIIAAVGAGNPGYNYNATSGLVVRLASGTSPVPGVNFLYSELGNAISFQPADGMLFKMDGAKTVHCGRTANVTNFYVQPQGLVAGSGQAYINHNITAVFSNCVSIGSSGNAFGGKGVKLFLVNTKDYDTWLDAGNLHSAYPCPNVSPDPTQGLNDFIFFDRHYSNEDHSGGDGRDPTQAPAVNTSANGPTLHERCRGIAINSQFMGSNGSNGGIVTGAHFITLGNIYATPKVVDPGDQVFSAGQLATDLDGSGTERTVILSAYDSGAVPGDAQGRSAMFVAGPYGDIGILGFNGPVTKVILRWIKFNTNPANGDKATLWGQVYTFKTTPVGPYDVQIGATRTDTCANFVAKINANASLYSDARSYATSGSTVAAVRKVLTSGQTADITLASSALAFNDGTPTITELSNFAGPPGPPGPPVADGTYGDVAVSGGAWSITGKAVTAAKMEDMPQGTISGRAAGAGAGSRQPLTAAQVKSILALAAGDISGLGSAATLAFDTDPTMAANSDSLIPTQAAVSAAINARVAGGGPAALLVDNNLDDLSSPSAARGNLGLSPFVTATLGAGLLLSSGVLSTIPTGDTVRSITAGTPGTGAYTPTAAAAGCRAWPTQPVGFYLVRFDDGSAWELSLCYWNATTLSRSSTQLYGSSTGSPLALTSAATATLVTDAFDIPPAGSRLTRTWAAGAGLAAPTAIGMPATVTGTGGSSGNISSTNPLTERGRILYTSATTANAQAGLSSASTHVANSTTAGRGGWDLQWGFGATQIPSGPRLFMGATSVTFVGNTGEPSALTAHLAAFGLDSTDAHLQLLTNSNAGGCTKIDTGITFAINDWYKAKLWMLPGSNTVHALLARVSTGEIFYTSTSSDVPADGSSGFLNVIGGLSSTTGTAIILHVGTLAVRPGN